MCRLCVLVYMCKYVKVECGGDLSIYIYVEYMYVCT